MKNLLITCIIVFVALPLQTVKAQTFCSSTSCSGSYYGITVNPNEDTVINGYLVYAIPIPDKGLNGNVTGPVSCYLQNYTGNVAYLCIHKRKLLMELDCIDAENINMEVEVQSNTLGYFHDVHNEGYWDYYHYHITLFVTNDN